MQGFLTTAQRVELLKELQLEDKRKYADRFRVILLLDKGWTHAKISEALFLDEGTIRNYRKRYVEGGIMDLIVDEHSGRCCFLTDKQLETLSSHLQSKIHMTAKEIADYIENTFAVTYALSGLTDLLHRLGFTYKKAKSIPGKANREAQELFILEYYRLKSEGEKIYFADSAHPHHNPVISYGWIKKGDNFEILSNSGRYKINITGAVDINSLEVITRTSDWVDASTICDLLRAIRQKNQSGEVVHLVMDNARYNRAVKVKELAEELGIILVYLPPYSPNLNPIERLWKFFKKKVLYNHYYKDFSDFEEASLKFFRYIRKYRDELSTLLTDNFEVFGT